MNPQLDFQNFIENCMNEKLQRTRLKVMLARQQEENKYNNALRAGGLPLSYSMCKNEKIRALNNLLNQIRIS
jgi:predicted AAA+ superfamily ATPase